MPIDAVLFDFHGVLTESPWALLASAGAGERDTVLELLLGDYAADTDHPWHRLERGEISLAEYATDLAARAQEAGVAIDFGRLRDLNQAVEVRPDVVHRIREVRRRGVRTALVTNNVRELSATWRSLVPLDDLFDAVVDSCEVGVRKPSPAIFAHALRLLGDVPPERAVFLDDSPGNVAGAERAGLRTVLVDDPGEALDALDAILAEV